MAWLSSFFKQTKPQNQQPLNDSPAQNSTTVMQILAEEAIMAVAQWMITFVNRTLQAKPPASIEEPPQKAPTTVDSTAPFEEVLSRFGVLIEQLQNRDQGIVLLQTRLHQIEGSIQENDQLKQQLQTSNRSIAALQEKLVQMECKLEQQTETFTRSIAALEEKLDRAESITQRVNALEQMNQTSQSVKLLENRMSQLEQLLARFNVIPKLVEGNYKAIAFLQIQLEALRTSRNSNHKNSHQESASVVHLR